MPYACPVECLPNGIYFCVYSIGAKPIPLGPYALCAMPYAFNLYPVKFFAEKERSEFNRGVTRNS
jgi:hypothetical protein